MYPRTSREMEAFKLLTTSTKLKRRGFRGEIQLPLPSAGAQDQLSDGRRDISLSKGNEDTLKSRKRKRDVEASAVNDRVELGNDAAHPQHSKQRGLVDVTTSHGVEPRTSQTSLFTRTAVQGDQMSESDCRTILKEHKVKVVDLMALHELDDNASPNGAKMDVLGKASSAASYRKAHRARCRVFPQPLTDFSQLQHLYGIDDTLARNIADQGYRSPTDVQLAILPLLFGSRRAPRDVGTPQEPKPDILAIAPTGSGKTLTFLVPLIHDLVGQKHHASQMHAERHVRALIVAPTKELVAQTVNEGRKLTRKTGVKIMAMRKGMSVSTKDNLPLSNQREGDFEDDPNVPGEGQSETIVKTEILVSTPLRLLNAKSSLEKIQYLILDEADVLLDPLFRDQTLGVWNNCTNPLLRVSLWSATMGSNVEELACSTMRDRQLRLAITEQPPLLRCIIGLKDSAIPNISHRTVYAATESGKLLGLRQLLHPSSIVGGRRNPPPLRPPLLVFTQTIERAIALHSELLYDIPAEAGGIERIAVLHADLSDTKRSEVMARFRKGQIWVLITTDLLSRGVDFRGVNGVVNYDIPTTSAAYVHRVGRTGRAGREGGVAVTFYTQEDIKYVKGIANMIAASEKSGDSHAEKGTGLQKWLLRALPDLTKKDRQELKTRGVEVRRGRRGGEDAEIAKAKRKARISTKSGYDRKLQHNRKGAVLGRRKRQQVSGATEDAKDEWDGIDD